MIEERACFQRRCRPKLLLCLLAGLKCVDDERRAQARAAEARAKAEEEAAGPPLLSSLLGESVVELAVAQHVESARLGTAAQGSAA